MKLIVSSVRYPTLETERHLTTAARQLARQCAVMRAIFAQTGTPPLRDFTADFAGLAKIVTGQQLSAASAAAIWTRVSSAIVPFDAGIVQRLPDATLAGLGLSSAKIRTLKSVARAIANDDLDFDLLNRARDDEVVDRLTALHGIGPWTADIYLLFALRRRDAFPAGDLALALAVQRLFKLKSRPNPKELLEIAERWRPHRATAARLLWADYAHAKTAAATGRPPAGMRARR